MTLEVPTFEHAGLLLRPWRDDDLDAVLELARDRQAWQWMPGLRQVDGPDGARVWLARRRGEGRVDWAACEAATGAVAGRVGLHHRSVQDHTAELGYAVWPAFRGRGVATSMVEAATRHAFDVLGLNRVVLLHAVSNVASCRVATRCGYSFEGVERQALDHGDGILHDVHRHARLSSDPSGRVAPGPALPQPIEPVEIAAGRLQLRPPSAHEADDALAMLTDPEVVRWNPVRAPLDLEGVRAWCARSADWSDGTHAPSRP